jgi:hypothetical protein
MWIETTWACCKYGWCKNSKEVIGRETRRRDKKRRLRLRRIDDVELDLRNVDVKRWRARALDRTERVPNVRIA